MHSTTQTTMRVLAIFGTRPEAVKMAPIVRELRSTPSIETGVCVTAQHRQMLDQVLDLFKLEPDFDLNLMRPNQSLAQLTAAIFTNLDPILKEFDPDWVLVQGDTTTVMAAALLAYYNKIRVGHVEAGLRTGDKWEPFPEEVNRRVAGTVADLHFAPTEWSRRNLLNEGVSDQAIFVTGNPVIDALHYVAKKTPTLQVKSLFTKIGLPEVYINQERDPAKRIIVITAHRRENFGQPLNNICEAIQQLSSIYPDDKFVYPVHLNPNVQRPVYQILGKLPNVSLLPPLDYLPLVNLLKHTTLLLTDSGGLQEEAPGFGIPVLVLRDVTERPEGVETGTVSLVGTDIESIVNNTRRLLDDPVAYSKMAQAVNPYGDGHAAKRIVKAVAQFEN